jgi:DNA-binding response OmpR family regulator
MAQQEAKEIFLIDDEISHLELICNALRKQGYRVLPTSGYCSEINAFRLYSVRLDLLVTAVALPREAGCELADTLLTLDPSLTVMFVSDPSEAAVCHSDQILGHRMHFLEKGRRGCCRPAFLPDQSN